MQDGRDQERRFAPVERCLALVQRGRRHERGAEAVESLALIAIVLVLLAVISLVFRDRAAAIGDAATATLARWLAGVPGTAPVGNTSVIAAPRVTALPYAVVSLPQLLGQAADAAPWVERAIGDSGQSAGRDRCMAYGNASSAAAHVQFVVQPGCRRATLGG